MSERRAAARGAAEVRLEGVGKRYGATWAVRDVTLTVEPGAFYTLLGPSGCGKTTLLRMIAGFVEPDTGTIAIDGARVDHVPPWRRGVGLVFQSYALWPHLTVFENVAFGLREQRVGGPEVRARVAQALRQVGLEGLERRRPSQLSGGQQQRVALARTLVVRPRVLLLDEPLSNLDAQLRAQMRGELARLQREAGITAIYVTHDQAEALSLSTRIAVLSAGEVVQESSPWEIYHRPRTRFVAGFIGAANLLDGVVVAAGAGGVDVDLGGGLHLRAAPAETAVAPGMRVALCVRPEALRPVAGAGAGPLAGRIERATFEGDRVRYEVAVGDTLTVRADAPTGSGDPPLTPGTAVTLAIEPSALRVLPG